MKTCTSGFNAEKAKSGNRPRTLLEFVFPYPVNHIYVSDGPWDTGVNTYQPLVLNWGPLTKTISPTTFCVTDWKITLSNTSGFKNYFDTYDPLEVTVYVYHWFEGTSDSDKLQIDTLVCVDILKWDDRIVEIDLAGMMEKKNKLIGTPINATTWPYADPDAFNYTENIIFGAPKNVLCPCVIAGGMSTFAEEVTSTATTIKPSLNEGESKFPAVPFIISTGSGEQMMVTSLGSDGKTWTVTRGYYSTTAVKHMKGEHFYEKRNDFTFLVAGHYVKSIGDVYVDGVRVLSGITKTTNTNPSGGGKAKIVFSDQFKLDKKVDIALSDPGHVHVNTSNVSIFANIGQVGYELGPLTSKVSNSTPDYGKVTGITVVVNATNEDPTYNMHISINDDSVCWDLSAGPLLIPANGSAEFTVAASYINPAYAMDWSTQLKVVIDDTDGRLATINSVEFIVTYEGDTSNNAAGVSLSGNSAADFIIGGEVTCDVEGWYDNTNGLYENPWWIADILTYRYTGYGYLNNDDGSGSATLTSLNTLGYKFAFVLNKPVEFKEILSKLAFQARCWCFEENGSIHFVFRPSSTAASVKPITTSMMLARSFQPRKTAKTAIVNDIKANYKKAWDGSEKFLGMCDRSAAYPAGGDTTSVEKNGIRENPSWNCFDFVYLDAHATGLRDFYIGKYKTRRDELAWSGFSDQVDLMPGDVVDVTHGRFGYSAYKVEAMELRYYPGSGKSKRGHSVEVVAETG